MCCQLRERATSTRVVCACECFECFVFSSYICTPIHSRELCPRLLTRHTHRLPSFSPSSCYLLPARCVAEEMSRGIGNGSDLESKRRSSNRQVPIVKLLRLISSLILLSNLSSFSAMRLREEARCVCCLLLLAPSFSSSYSPKFSAVLSVEDFVVDCVGVSLVACLRLSLSLSLLFLICSLLIPDRVVVE